MKTFVFKFQGTNLRFEWWHFANEKCPNFNKRFTMAEKMGCEVCGFCPAQSKREEKDDDES